MIRDSSFCLFMIKEFKTLKPATIPCPTIPRRPFLFTARVQVIRYASFSLDQNRRQLYQFGNSLFIFWSDDGKIECHIHLEETWG